MTYQDDEEVVISGIGGKFPEVGSVAELAKKLFAGESLLTKDERKLTKGHYEEVPEYSGKTTNNVVLFDNTFFGISPIVSSAMDPLTCQILQRTFEAIYDAGINPSDLRGTNAAVFSGTTHSDSDLEWATDTRCGYGIMGRNRCMNSNRISYWLDVNGTSVSTDSGWTSGISNLYLGWEAIRSGKCDTAIVSTASLQSHPLITIQFKDYGFLSPDGISRTFDDSANGHGRSSAVVVLVLQRATQAKRCYAIIGHIYATNFGDRHGVISKPSRNQWNQLFTEFYDQANIDVNDVHYIEAYGASSKEEDAEELNAIYDVFCKERESPLLVGCVKSNMGHTEASSAFCGIVKSVIALESGIIPQNLHYKRPNSLCPALARGQIKIVDKNTAISHKGWVAVNAHGFGGSYAHMVFRANPKSKTLTHDGIPRLVLLADRTNDYMDDLLRKVESVPFDLEFIGLLHEVHSKRIEKYLGRGYTILPKMENPIHEHQAYGSERRPLWFIFSGMGSQWPKMGKRLMDLPLFRESIEKSHELLAEKGLDLINIITTDDPNIFDNILHSFVGIAAIQVALVDVMRALNIKPDGYIGHSVGELGCAYADDCFTAGQMVLAAYYRGRASTETELVRGSMAAVGKGYNDIKDQLPEGIEVACHNSEDSCTLSGPVDLIHKFVAELKGKGIFAKSVNVSNIAYHSRYIRPAAPKLLTYLKQVVKNPKLRSSKWISTSNAESDWDTEVAKYCSAEYHTNNLLSSVLFEEGSKHIPKNAICVEIAPHGLLQAILKRSLGEEVTNIPLTSRSAEDPLVFLLQAIGKMYMAGVDPVIVNLYPKVEYPVSRGTHVLHHLVHWHEQLSVAEVLPVEKKVVYSFKRRLVDIADDGTGYVANGQNIYPVSIILQLVWDIFASALKKPIEECSVVFQNFRLEHPIAVHLSEKDNIITTVALGSGNFELMTDHVLATGTISLLKDQPLAPGAEEAFVPDLVGDEIYNELKRKGFGVGEDFKNLSAVSIDEEVLVGKLPVNLNWVQSIEALLQLHMLKAECPVDFLAFPRAFQRLEISWKGHSQYINSLGDSSCLTATYEPIINIASCGGVRIWGLKSMEIPKLRNSLKFPFTKFYPLMNPPLENNLEFAGHSFSLVLDNMDASENLTVVNVMEVVEPSQASSIGLHLQQTFSAFKIKLKTVTSADVAAVDNPVDFLIIPQESLVLCANRLVEDGFVLLKTTPGRSAPLGFNLIGRFEQRNGTKDELLLLLKKDKAHGQEMEFILAERSEIQLANTLSKLQPSEKVVYVVSYQEPAEGLANFKKRMQAKSIVRLRWIFILDPKAPRFDNMNPFYSEQLRKGLSTIVYKDGSWRGYLEFSFSEGFLQEDINLSLESSKEIEPAYVSFDLKETPLKIQQVEFSGKMNGVKVMGISKLAQHKKIIWDRYLTWETPESWSLEDAATAPLSYALAYYCLVVVGKVKANENVMVTDGLTSIGQASIAVALTVASRVLVTVNNEEEKLLIRKLFPQLNESDVISHENPRFYLLWKSDKKNSNAQVIISTLEGERFFSLLNCTGQYGRIFHFGQQDAKKNARIGSSAFLMSLTFYCKSPEIITKLPEEEKQTLHELLSDGIRKGVVRPLPRVVLPFDELKKLQSKTDSCVARARTLVPANTMQQHSSYVRFDTSSSYLIIGDDSDVWIDVAEWMINRGLQNIVISGRDHTKRSHLRMPYIKKHKSVFVCHHEDVEALVKRAQKLGPIAAVYYISMTSSEVGKRLAALDKCWRSAGSHLLAITKGRGSVSELCAARSESGFPSTNFIWDAEEMFINEHLEFMGKVSGKSFAILVSPSATLSKSDHKLVDHLPTTIDDFCDLGSSLTDQFRITPLRTLAGGAHNIRELTPLFFIPGLQKDPLAFLQSVVSDYLFPAFCVQVPDLKLSLPIMASFILPEIVKLNKGMCFNIVGVSWGTHLAIELARKLEEMGAVVGLMLIEGPFLNSKTLVTKSLESDLLNLIQELSKSTATSQLKFQNEVVTEKTWQGYLNKTLSLLNLPSHKVDHFTRAATFIYNCLRALLDQDTTALTLRGPLTVVVSEGHSFDDKSLWKLSKSILIRSFPVSRRELLSSSSTWKIIHGSSISQAMSKNTVYECSWPALEEFMTQKLDLKLDNDFQALN